MESAVLQICLSAAMTLVALPVMVKGTLGWLLPRQTVQWVARLAPRLACGAIMVLSLSRVAALLLNYGAPLQVYRQLPAVGQPLGRAVGTYIQCLMVRSVCINRTQY